MWLLYCALCLLAWGTWSFLPKLSQKTLDTTSAAVYQVVGGGLLFAVPAAVGFLLTRCVPALSERLPPITLHWHPVGGKYALATGVCGALGSIFYLLASKSQSITIVVTLTAVYPIVTVLMGWKLLGEQVQPRQWVGIALALAAMALVAQPPAEPPRHTPPHSTARS